MLCIPKTVFCIAITLLSPEIGVEVKNNITAITNLLVAGIAPVQLKRITRNENIGLLSNSIIMAVSFLNPWAGLVLSFVMWIYRMASY